MTGYVEKDKIGVGIEGRSKYPVRLTFGDLFSSFSIKAQGAHRLIAFLKQYSTDYLEIESIRGSFVVHFIEKETLAIGAVNDLTVMLLTKEGFEELHRLLTLTVPKLQDFIERNWAELTRKQTDDNLRGVFE